MPVTHDMGRVFFHALRYPSTHHPLVELGSSCETSYPYRRGRSLVLRVPLSRRAWVFGIWGAPGSEDEVLRQAVGARNIVDVDWREWDD